MAKIENIVTHFVFFLLCLLAFLLLFEQYVTIPFWLQPLGRMHPMVLHFPITLIVLLVLLDLFKTKIDAASYEKVHKALLYLTVLSTALSAVMGFFLSREESYASDLMALHKWIGVAGSYLLFTVLFLDPKKWGYKVALYGSLGIVFFAGHFGAGLTHGMNFLVEPLLQGKQAAITEQTPLYEAFVDPVLEAKCQSCHNPQKHKGDLDMTTFDLLLKGGENGPVWIAGNPDESEVIRRALLPLEDEAHMPPEGKPQLTRDEIALLQRWIGAGADPNSALADLHPTDSLYLLASQLLAADRDATTVPRYDFKFADQKLLASLNHPYRTVIQETPGSPALDVNIYVRHAYQRAYLTELQKIKHQIVSLNLAYLPVNDEDMETLGDFVNLERLNLNHTDITGATLHHLRSCTQLRSLSLSGTQVDATLLKSLEPLQGLRDVFIWNTALKDEDIQALRSTWPDIQFHTGYSPDEDPPIQLSPPLLKNKERIVEKGEKIVLEHKLPGVSIRYTTDGSDPDSLSSPLYTEPLPLQTRTHFKAISYKDGWLASAPVAFKFFIKGHQPAGAELLYHPDPKYKGNGALSLTDHKQGAAGDFAGRSWLGYKDTPFAALVDFGEAPPELQEVVLSYGRNMGSYIMPPVAVEVWGGDQKQTMKLLKKVVPPPPAGYEPNEEAYMALPIPDAHFRYYKVVAQPLKKLPSWHAGQGEQGWVFVDELFFY